MCQPVAELFSSCVVDRFSAIVESTRPSISLRHIRKVCLIECSFSSGTSASERGRVICVMCASERENGRTDRCLRVALALLEEKNSDEGRPTSEGTRASFSSRISNPFFFFFFFLSSIAQRTQPWARLHHAWHSTRRPAPFLPRRGNAASFTEHVSRRSGPLSVCVCVHYHHALSLSMSLLVSITSRLTSF